ncbi:hypothetical protein OIV19_23475 [Brucella sp. HL-2]|nr:hypothetical protein [Brucella sp. HL-2]MCV9910502.1 hypothetical protein [Brucella sp. HL-2]
MFDIKGKLARKRALAAIPALRSAIVQARRTLVDERARLYVVNGRITPTAAPITIREETARTTAGEPKAIDAKTLVVDADDPFADPVQSFVDSDDPVALPLLTATTERQTRKAKTTMMMIHASILACRMQQHTLP